MNIIFSVFTAYKMRLLKRLIFSGVLFMTVLKCYSQESECGQREVLFPTIKLLNFPTPKPGEKSDQDDVLTDLQFVMAGELTQKNPSLKINRVFMASEDAKSFFGNSYKYILLVSIVKQGGGIQLLLTLKSSCSDKVLAKTDVFLPYALITENPEQVTQLARQAASTLASLINIEEFELKERAAHNYGLGGENWGGRVDITVDKTLVKGQETQVQMKVIDCDGEVLKNKQISTNRTIGGVFTPAIFTTDADGIATAKFRMTSDKRAIIVALCKTENVQGCQDLYTGSEIIKGLGGNPIKIEIAFFQDETRTLKRATLPGIKVKGGEEAEMTQMNHRTVMYHYPSQKSLKEGFLIDTEKEGYYIGLSEEEPDPDVKTIYVTESGSYYYSKNVANAKIIGMIGNVEAVVDEEKGSTQQNYGSASLQHPSEITFHKGDANNPPSFSWNVEYPVSNDGIAGGAVMIAKGDENVRWQVSKITDPKSIYKTEYLLTQKLDAAEELKKGNKGMKDLFGFDVDDLTKAIDPTNPQTNIAGADGGQIITVRILSPYPAD